MSNLSGDKPLDYEHFEGNPSKTFILNRIDAGKYRPYSDYVGKKFEDYSLANIEPKTSVNIETYKSNIKRLGHGEPLGKYANSLQVTDFISTPKYNDKESAPLPKYAIPRPVWKLKAEDLELTK
jgi:hypothetical protein